MDRFKGQNLLLIIVQTINLSNHMYWTDLVIQYYIWKLAGLDLTKGSGCL